MPRGKGKHLARENREVIESGVRDGDSASRIGARIDRGASTVTREVRRNRTVKEPARRAGAKPAVRCAHYPIGTTSVSDLALGKTLGHGAESYENQTPQGVFP